MELIVNGDKREVPAGVETTEDLLQHLNINKETVVVEHNLKILKRAGLSEARLEMGDVVEIIRFVGGG
jgi:sulfur carrier protein